jgi:hypothetical protein
MLNKLTLTFEVNDDDLTSERIAEYRAAVIRALECVDEGDTTLDYCPLTYKLLHDVNEIPEDNSFGQYIKPDGTIFDAHGPVNTEENFEICLALFLSAAQDKINVYFVTNFAGLAAPTLVLDRNRKYVRVVKEDAIGSGRSVYCFINTENGDILKGSWKAPVKKGVRGNIFSGDHGVDRVNHHGCIYLR